MAGSLALPLVATLALAAIVTSLHRRLPPRLATRIVTLATVLVALAVVPSALVIGLAFLAHAPIVGSRFEWCAQAFGLHGSVPAWLGVPTLAVLGVGALRTVRLLRQHHSLRLDESHPIHIAHSQTPYAVTLPGPAGQIVISSAMIELLDDDERRIVVAHEQAHARYRHDRYLLTAELAAALMPPLRALSRRVTYSIERWADEAAAAECGDRERVAVTLGKVALRSHPTAVAGFAGLGVASRMGALLEPPIRTPHVAQLVALWSSLAVTSGFSVYQLHLVSHLLTALCPH